MPSTSIPQPAVRRFPAPRRRATIPLRTAQARSALARRAEQRLAHAGHGGLAQRRARLEARWRARLERVTALSLAYHDEAAATAGPAASAGSGRARQLARQVVAERQALAEIEAALDRIAAGQYGSCEQCGRAVAAARLTAQPEVRYCAACARVPPQGRLSAHYQSQPGQRIAYA